MQRITGRGIGAAHVFSCIGLLYHRQNRIREAINMFDAAIEIYAHYRRNDEAAPVYASLGKVYFDSGDLNLAEVTLSKALEMYSLRKGSQEAIDTISNLLDLISERR
ncbi:tetratricopeptide repeat protein [Candidatus Latescibacterota bacterium]